MSHLLTEGPLGFPMLDQQAQAVEAVLKDLPRDEVFSYRKLAVPQAVTELSPGERADVSWISTEQPDRLREVILARGLDDTQYRLNPIVTLNHRYWDQPVGKSVWRKVIREGQRGVKAKTLYPPRPASWPEGKDWLPDLALGLVQSDLLRGKSIGFLPVAVHQPTPEERDQNGWAASEVELVIDRWLLLEYACCYLPVNQSAVVEVVAKSLPGPIKEALGIAASPVFPFIDVANLRVLVQQRVEALNFTEMIRDSLDRKRGRV